MFCFPNFYRERNTELIRDAIRMRYMLLPYFYTLFREANTSGVPVARPLWMEFPSDEATFSNDEAFMVGNSLLVQGIYSEVCQHLDFHCIDLYLFSSFFFPFISDFVLVCTYSVFQFTLLASKACICLLAFIVHGTLLLIIIIFLIFLSATNFDAFFPLS